MPENENVFPDALMSYEARSLGYSTWLYNKIRCGHKRGRWIPFLWSRFNWFNAK
jgi:hypothetical protein